MKTHWLQSPNKNYLGHWDLPDGKDLVLTIESAKWEEVKNPIINKSEAKRVIRFVEPNTKPFICNQTNASTILKSTGIKFMEDANGQKIQFFVGNIKDRVSGDFIDCLRIRPKVIQKSLPEMHPGHGRWGGAKKAISEGSVTIDQILETYTISEKNIELLCSK